VISACLSLLFGILPFLTGVPVVLPVFGLALGLNAVIKERRQAQRKPLERYLGIAGALVSAAATAVLLL
jgi:hypothetical protein